MFNNKQMVKPFSTENVSDYMKRIIHSDSHNRSSHDIFYFHRYPIPVNQKDTNNVSCDTTHIFTRESKPNS